MKTQVPEDLTPLAAEALRQLEADLVTEFNALYDAEDGADLAVLAEIAAALDGVRAAISTAEEAAEQDAAHRQALADRVNPPSAEDEDDTAPADDTDDDAVTDAPEAVETPAEPELVTASAKPATPARKAPSAAGVRRSAPTPTAPPTDGMPAVITAAADIPGFGSGQKIDTLGVADAMHARARGLADRSARMPVAAVKVPIPDEFMIRKDSDADAVITAAVDSVLKGKDAEALIAAGGWCAPSETMYDQFSVESRDGLLDLPSVGITRGGINVPSYFGIGDAAGALWTWTEANDVAANGLLVVSDIDVVANVATATTSTAHGLAVGSTVTIVNASVPGLNETVRVLTVPTSTTFTYTSAVTTATNATASLQLIKGCLDIPCPVWTEYKLGAEGLCLSHGNLMDRSYPEQTRRFVDLTMTAHMHRLSNAKLAKIIATATAVTVATAPSDVAGDVLNAIDLQVADYRSQHLASENVVLDAIFPMWVKNAVRSTLAMRAGVLALDISTAQVVGYFTERNVRPQFLHGYDPLYRSATPATGWPATTKFLLFFAGAYVEGDGGNIDLGVVRDSRLNATNDFTAAWSEQFYLVMRRGPAAREVTFTVGVNGRTGGPEFLGV